MRNSAEWRKLTTDRPCRWLKARSPACESAFQEVFWLRPAKFSGLDYVPLRSVPETNSKAIRKQFVNSQIVRAGGCPAQWQSTGCTSQVSWVLFPATAGLFTFLYFRLKKTSNLSLFQREARVSKQQQQYVCSRNLCEWWELGTAYIHLRGIEFTFGQQTPGPNNYGTRLFYSTSHS